MRLDEGRCWEVLAAARHGVLATVHPSVRSGVESGRGVDAVPVVFAVLAGAVVVPVDAVKPKASARLQRLVNVEADPRCVLLVDHYDDDWSRLWWVRVHGRATTGSPSQAGWAALAARYPQYRAPDSLVAMITLTPTAVMGWQAAPLEH